MTPSTGRNRLIAEAEAYEHTDLEVRLDKHGQDLFAELLKKRGLVLPVCGPTSICGI